MDDSPVCPVCGRAEEGLAALAVHFVERSEASDGPHVMWLNRNVTKQRMGAAELEKLLGTARDGGFPPGPRVER
jgi:hypothetical protein